MVTIDHSFATEHGSCGAFPVWFAAVIPIEREADKITGWQTTAVPGLLQTEHYARSVIRARSPRDADEATERTVQARMERQSILSLPRPPLCCYVLAEAVLRHVIGSHDVMAEQLEKLVKAAEAPGFVIQVKPISRHAV